MRSNRFLSAPALAGLKDFQRRSVDYVFKRLYGDDPTSRFLIADEVGLGKTLVARGIIAKTLEHLQNEVDRVDVIYICSNAAIATQNVNRLNVSDTDGFSIATRLTYLPRQVRSLRKNKVNFISLTPGTAFDHARSRGGHADERAILYRMLYDLLLAQNERPELREGLLNLLQAKAGKDNWRAKAKNLPAEDLDADLSKAFRRAVIEDAELYAALKEGCERFARYRDYSRIPWEDSELRYDLIGKLRSKLASVCLSALEPDLVILDEFQRFKHLLDGDDEASMLATALFEHPNVRVLLLSATPYKMFTLDQENDEDDHYPDFIRTLNFLFNDSGKVDTVKNLLSEHRTALHACAKGSVCQPGKKAELERALLKVMCRTEWVATTPDHNSMLREIPPKRMDPLITPADLQHAKTVDEVATCVKAGEPIEYWKSAPYLINFLKHYELRHKLDAQLNAPSDKLRGILSSANGQLLTKSSFEGYQALDPANPRMRVLFKDTIDKGMWQLLWMPPSMPYSEPGGVYQDKDGLTKALVFSSWSAVPDAIASICSYEAERKMIAGTSVSHSELYDKIRPLLRFAVASNDNRLTGMPVIAWLLPSPTLATEIDPLEIALRRGSGPLKVQELRDEVKAICRRLVKELPDAGKGTQADERWYWAAPILLDSRNGLLNWCKTGWGSATPDHESGTRFKDHIDLLVSMAEGNIPLGPQPDDLVDVLCDLALAGPGVCALRALRRIGAGIDAADPNLLSAAARIASGFRSLFNMPETIAMLRGSGEDTYWRLTLQYGIDGNLQSVLDEYVHVLRESLGLQEHSPEGQVSGIAECIQSVLSLRTAQIRIDEIKMSGEGFALDGFNTRCRFALRFGDIRDDNNQALVRADSVRDAFNSPFRPFVLASTSIGQEGLDFHNWCHAVVHWNLPANPVDLEQREGRVHRYKGHAVRKNIAERYGLAALSEVHRGGDPWQTLFQIAAQRKPNGCSDLIPYWICKDGSAQVERRIPLLPYSKEVGKLKRLKQGLALYRMVFGQPRQEDLLFSLSQNGNHESLADWLISLQPPETLD